MRGATGTSVPSTETLPISTHAPHARRGANIGEQPVYNRISTHAPHARRGDLADRYDHNGNNFYSRA